MQKLSLVLGGASSGKSAYAEGIVSAAGRPRAYLATAQAFDPEMAARIERHRRERGPNWRIVDAPLDVAAALRAARADEAVLLDSVTVWLGNVLLAERDADTEAAGLLAALLACLAPVVVVSDEVGLGIVPDNALARRFREALGRLNQRIAARADLVVLVAAGLPLALKGRLP